VSFIKYPGISGLPDRLRDVASPPMKRMILLLFAGVALSSCNTTIGVGRDLREGYDWTRNQFQQSGSGSGNYNDVVY